MPKYTPQRKLPYIDVDADTFRSTAIMTEEAATRMSVHSHPDLEAQIKCLEDLLIAVQKDTKRILGRKVGDLFDVVARRPPKADAVGIETQTDESVDLAHCIPLATANQAPRTQMNKRFATTIDYGSSVALTVVKTKTTLTEDQDSGN